MGLLRTMKFFNAALLAACSCIASFASPVGYLTIGAVAPAHTFTATTSADEIGYFYGSTALYNNVIGVWENGVQIGSFALDNHSSAFGQSYDFGHVDAGATIVIALEVLTRGYTVYSDPAMNSDGSNHVYTMPFFGQTKKGVAIASGTFVSFEDLLLPRSNLNYNDEDVIFSDLTATAVAPEPGTAALLGAAMMLAAGFASHKRMRRIRRNAS
jgi:hypothetical protein